MGTEATDAIAAILLLGPFVIGGIMFLCAWKKRRK